MAKIQVKWAALALLLVCGQAAADLAGKVVSVHDGHSLTVLVDGTQVNVRLAEIYAPELKQPFGARSKQSLSDLCLGKDAQIDHIAKDRNGRTIARVLCNGVDANAAQIERGMAWVYKRYTESTSPLYFLQDTAQRAREGLWRDSTPVEPWVWRRSRR